MTFTRPYRIAGYAVLDAAGQVVAQGSPELCAQVMAGSVSTVTTQGDLFDAD